MKRREKSVKSGGLIDSDSEAEDDEDASGSRIAELERLEGLETTKGASATPDEDDLPGRGLGGLSGSAARLAGAVGPALRSSVHALLKLALGLPSDPSALSTATVLHATSLLGVLANHLKILDFNPGASPSSSASPFAAGGT